jgi:hypothetical protein
VKSAVSGLEEAYPGRVTARNVDATTPEGHEAAKQFGFKSHGLVVRSKEGKALWTQADHTVRVEDVRKALDRILAS